MVWPRSSGDRQVKIRFLNPMSTAHTATLSITGASYTTSLGTTNLSITPSSSQLNFPSSGEDEETLTVSGLPNYVAKGALLINFTLVADGPGGTSLSGGVGAEVFLTESSPLGIQNPVWRDVLEDACGWAIGQSGAENCRMASTAGLYDSYFFYYESAQPIYTVESPDGSRVHQYYRLQHLFEARASYPYQTNADCSDIANYLMIAFKALGVTGDARRHFPVGVPAFQTHFLRGLGHVGTTSFNFAYHQTGAASGLIYDSAAAQLLDLSGNSYDAAPAGWTEAGYWQTPHPNPPPGASEYLGLVWRPYQSTVPEGEEVFRTSSTKIVVGYVIEN